MISHSAEVDDIFARCKLNNRIVAQDIVVSIAKAVAQAGEFVNISAIAALEPIPASSADQKIVAIFPPENIVAAVTGEYVVALAALDLFGVIAAGQDVVARIAENAAGIARFWRFSRFVQIPEIESVAGGDLRISTWMADIQPLEDNLGAACTFSSLDAEVNSVGAELSTEDLAEIDEIQ